MQITHAEARRFIHLKADKSLSSDERDVLFAHLQNCMECQAYAHEIAEVEGILVPVLKRQWDRQPLPLSVSTFIAKRPAGLQPSIILTMRSVMISVIFVAFLVTAWQFAFSNGRPASGAPVEILAVPTPSTQATKTKIALSNCEWIRYQVQADDTLDSIAAHFSVPKEELMAINNLESRTLHSSIELLVPICGLTATGTANPIVSTRTYTPVTSPMFSTPAGT